MKLTPEFLIGLLIGCWLYYQVRIFAVDLRERIHDKVIDMKREKAMTFLADMDEYHKRIRDRIIEDKREKAMIFLADMDEYQQILRRERYDR